MRPVLLNASGSPGGTFKFPIAPSARCRFGVNGRVRVGKYGGGGGGGAVGLIANRVRVPAWRNFDDCVHRVGQVNFWSARVHLAQADDKRRHQLGSGDPIYLL